MNVNYHKLSILKVQYVKSLVYYFRKGGREEQREREKEILRQAPRPVWSRTWGSISPP